MKIRHRLTAWFSTVFGILLIAIIITIFMAHRSAQYNDVDQLLINISSHIQDSLVRNLDSEKQLTTTSLSLKELTFAGVFVSIDDKNGNMVAKNLNSFNKHQVELPKDQRLSIQTIVDDDFGRYRILVEPVMYKGKLVGYIQSEMSLRTIDESIETFGWIIFSATVVGLLLAALGGWFLAKKALYRVELINQTARSIAASKEFQMRVLYEGPKDELGELSVTFNEMLESLEKVYMSQKNFIANVSHELRAPLTTILGNLDLLIKHKFSANEEKEVLADSRYEAMRMSKLIRDLLSLARADAGHETKHETVYLSKLLRELEFEIQGWKKPVDVKYHIDENVKIWGDVDSIKQLLLILIENAMNYTGNEGVIMISTYIKEEKAVLSVADNGIGIEKDELSLIFDRFYRTESARMTSQEGTGLGLSIAKWIVDKHNGTIDVKSEVDKDTTFTISFPKLN